MNLDEQILKFLEEAANPKLLLEERRIKFKMLIPDDVKQIADVFASHGKELYVVGGAVRDAVLGDKIKDYDLATNATPTTIENIMRKAGYKTLATGKAFGVINVFTDNGEYEIATFREDVGKGRRPDSVNFTTIENDVKRRDLTMNALFYDIEKEEIVDMVGGLDDLKNNKVKTVGFAIDRFDEDRLRTLRAIRFAVRFNGKLSNSINAALSTNSSLEGISNERIRDEFVKSIKSAKNINYLLQLYKKYNLFPEVLKNLNVDIFKLNSNNPVVVIASILKNNNLNNLIVQLNALTYSTTETKGIVFLVMLSKLKKTFDIIQIKKQQKLSYLSDNEILDFAKQNNLDLKLIKNILNFNLSVNGNEVMNQFGLKGIELGNKIKELEQEKFNNLNIPS